MGRNFAINQGLDTILPCIFKGDVIDVLENVDPEGRLAHLKPGTAVVEILGRVTSQGSPVGSESSIDGNAILYVRPDEDIKIFSCTRLGMPTAYPPTTRYSTLWAFKADKSSFRSWAIKADSLEAVGCNAEFGDSGEPVAGGNTLPIPIGLCLLLPRICHSANRLIHHR